MDAEGFASGPVSLEVEAVDHIPRRDGPDARQLAVLLVVVAVVAVTFDQLRARGVL